MLVNHYHLKPCKSGAHTVGQNFGLVSGAEADVVEDEQDGGFSAGVFGLSQFHQQFQSSSEPEDHLLSVFSKRHVQQQPEPERQRLHSWSTASTTGFRHGERQEVLQEVTLGEIEKKFFVNTSLCEFLYETSKWICFSYKVAFPHLHV